MGRLPGMVAAMHDPVDALIAAQGKPEAPC